jgi:beta-lactamase superfamily II metal-dependent hydrolase
MFRRFWLPFVLLSSVCLAAAPSKQLTIEFVDTEGGQATLLVTPSGQSMLIDAGWPGNQGRDSDRIIAAAKRHGLSKIDIMLVTHYHLDHVGGVPELAAKFPIGMMIDHGDNTETTKQAQALEENYRKVIAQGVKRMSVKPGDLIPLRDVKVEVVTARGEHAPKPLKGAGMKDNPHCGEEKKKDDPTENGRSIGVLISFGKFRFVDLGDLTWNKELEIACPKHFIGAVDLYLTTHHGLDQSGPKAIVHGLRPRVAVMNNGARKGGSPSAWAIVSSSPGLEDLWQLHYSIAGAKTHNVADDRIANLEEKCQGHGIMVKADKNRTLTVTNLRNNVSKTYKP